MNSLIKFLPLGDYTCIGTSPVVKGIAKIEYSYDNNNINGLLFRFDGFKLANGNKIPSVSIVKYLTDGTIKSYNNHGSVKTGVWTITDNSLVLLTNGYNNKQSESKKHIITRIGNIITNTSFHMIDNDYIYSTTEVFVGNDKTETKETMVSKNKNSNYILFQNILAIIIVLILIFYFIYLSK